MNQSCTFFYLLFLFLLLNSCIQNVKASDHKTNILDIIYEVADEFNMKVMCDIDLSGGDLYKQKTIDELTHNSDIYIEHYFSRYGHHSSFWGWYLNNEINPIENSDYDQSFFWRTIWKSIVDKCNKISPGTKVTISPFFLLDKKGFRGFKYLEPNEYEEWWFKTLKETGIDILMLQDSGAEHLSFFTLEERRSFFEAFANACSRAGKEFWINVESGEVEATDWSHALKMEQNFNRNWVYTDINWLKQKLNLAAEYGTGIVNWGYYPLMNPMEQDNTLSILNIDGQTVDLINRKKNYDDYMTYVNNISDKVPVGKLTQPKINGTLWFLPSTINHTNIDKLEKAVRQEIMNQKKIGFSFLWICNTPEYFSLYK